MQTDKEKLNSKTLDSYSLLIVSKYFKKTRDYLNIMCVNSKFKETTEKLRYNPIPIKSMKLFPKIQTQYLYSRKDKKMALVEKYEIWYYVNYDEYLKISGNNIKCHHIRYTSKNRLDSNNYLIPNNVDILCERCFYCNYMESITVPTNVTYLGNRCFWNCLKLKNVELPNFLNCIKYGCFLFCTSLNSITIPTSVSLLEDNIFSNCYSLQNVELPKSLTSIGKYCFSECSNLKTITLPPLLEHIGRGCFYCCGIESMEIPESIKTIGIDCFHNCNKLTCINTKSDMIEFTFPVTYRDYLLYNKLHIKCSNIIIKNDDALFLIKEAQNNNSTTIVIPNGVVELTDYSFSYKNLQSIILPTTVTSIGDCCFVNCTKLTSVLIQATSLSIGNSCFLNCSALLSINIPTTLTKFRTKCFQGCDLLKGVINVPSDCF
ncbi:hypothetical protein QTN25_008211 [Entamoeba marina]